MTLSQEAASLHLVLEMRNQEVRTLREKTACLEHRLDKFENVQVGTNDDEDFINIFLPCPCTSETINVYLLLQEELKKARARVEDLEEQIRMKDKLEK